MNQLDRTAPAAIAQLATPAEAKELAAKAAGAQQWAKKARAGLHSVNHAAEIKARAERRCGALLAQLARAQGSAGESPYQLALRECGIEGTTARRWQRIAAMTDALFEATLIELRSAPQEITTAALLRAERREYRRRTSNRYDTPAWIVHVLWEVWAPPTRWVVEAGGGNGAMVRAAKLYHGTRVVAVEQDPSCDAALRDAGADRVHCPCDWMGYTPELDIGAVSVISNPPSPEALAFVAHAIEIAGWVAALLPLSFQASETRAGWNNAHPPTQRIVLGSRPRYLGARVDGDGGSQDWAWFIWARGAALRPDVVAVSP